MADSSGILIDDIARVLAGWEEQKEKKNDAKVSHDIYIYKYMKICKKWIILFPISNRPGRRDWLNSHSRWLYISPYFYLMHIRCICHFGLKSQTPYLSEYRFRASRAHAPTSLNRSNISPYSSFPFGSHLGWSRTFDTRILFLSLSLSLSARRRCAPCSRAWENSIILTSSARSRAQGTYRRDRESAQWLYMDLRWMILRVVRRRALMLRCSSGDRWMGV